jgi:acyl-[acyl-carrier-protein] desaturase
LRDSVVREKYDRAFIDFFKSAETKRRWNVFNDIPWDHLDPSKASAQTLSGVEHTISEELYLPDYTSKIMPLVRGSFGHAWFWINWSYEESKHSLALRQYLIQSGHRSTDSMNAFHDSLSSLEWEVPFETVRQMSCYGALQEAVTYLGYRTLRNRAIADNDKVLGTIFDYIGRDEAAHAGFYRTLLAIDLEDDREGAIADLAHVIPRFKMPGDGLVPGYNQKLEDAGLAHEASWYVEKVVMPTLRAAGTTWEELRAQSRKRAPQRGASPA